MASDLKWSKHVVHKANKVLGLLKHTVLVVKIKIFFSNLYKALVRPILEYTCPVWSPHLAKDIYKMLKVQRRASQSALDQKEMMCKERCKILKCTKVGISFPGGVLQVCIQPE